jgi:hypothetical protein
LKLKAKTVLDSDPLDIYYWEMCRATDCSLAREAVEISAEQIEADFLTPNLRPESRLVL